MSSLFDFQQDGRLDRLNFRTGLFIALAFVVLAAVVAGTLLRQGVFTQTSSLYFFSESALGVARGMSVQLSGFKIGTVEAITLEPDTRVKTRLVVNSEYMRHITQDAEARLVKEGLIGASFIEILPGSRDARPMPNNGVLKFERAGDFAALAEGLADKLHPILDDVKKITEAVADPKGDIQITLRNVREATAAVGELQKELTRLARTANERTDSLTAQAGRVLERVDATLGRADGAIGTLNSTLGTVDKQLPQILLRIDRTLTSVEAISSDARRISSGLANDVPPAVSQGRAVLEDTQEIIDAAKRAWPIRGLLPDPLEQTLPLDSHDGARRP